MKVKQTKSETTDIKTISKEECITNLSSNNMLYRIPLKPDTKRDEKYRDGSSMKDVSSVLVLQNGFGMTARMTVGKGCFYECI